MARLAPPPELYDVVSEIESNNMPNRTSSAGARHEMQVMPAVAADPGFGIAPAANDSAEEFNRVGRDLLDAHYDYFGGDVPLTLAAYNAGRGAVNKHGGVPPYAETQNYVNKGVSKLGERLGDDTFSPEEEAQYQQWVSDKNDTFSPEEEAQYQAWVKAKDKPAEKPAEAPVEEQGRFGTALSRGVDVLQEAAKGVELGARAMFGDKEGTEQKFAEAKAVDAADAAKNGIKSMRFQDIQDIADKKGWIEAAKELPGYIGEKVVESAPSTALPLSTAAAAGMFFPPAAIPVGIATAIVQQFGSMIDRQVAEKVKAGDLEPGYAALAAIPAGALDFFTDKLTLGLNLSGAAKQIAKDEAKKELEKTILRRVGEHVAKGVALEAPTEAAQTELERAQAGLSLTDESALAELKESAIAGGLAGGVTSGVASIPSAITAKKDTEEHIDTLGSRGLDIIDNNIELTPEDFAKYGDTMALGVSRATAGSTEQLTTEQAYEQLKSRVGVPVAVTPTTEAQTVTPKAQTITPEAQAVTPEATAPITAEAPKTRAQELGLSEDTYKNIRKLYDTDAEFEQAHGKTLEEKAKRNEQLDKLKTVANPDETVTIGDTEHTKQDFIRSQIINGGGNISFDQAEENFNKLKPTETTEPSKPKPSAPLTFAGEDVLNIKSPTNSPVINHFTTAQGSEYIQTADGMTRWNKSEHANTVPTDVGVKDWQQHAVFIDPAHEVAKNAPFGVTVSKLKEQGHDIAVQQDGSTIKAMIYDKTTKDWREAVAEDAYPKAVASGLISGKEKIAAPFTTTPTTGFDVFEYNQNTDGSTKSVHAGSPVATVTPVTAQTTPESETKPSYSVGETNTTGYTAEKLKRTLTPEMRRLVETGKAVLHDTQATLPGENHPMNVQGMTTADGVTHYVANKLNPTTIQNVALHEVGVHAGMEKMLGAKVWEDVKNQAMTNQGKEFDAARAAVPKGTPANLRAEETLAYLVENSRHLPLVRRIIAAIRNWARTTLGANIKLTEADARQLAVTSMRRESKTSERTAREETAFSKGELLAPNGKPSNLNAMRHAQVRTPEFKKWFGDWENDPEDASKVVDENGEPLVVYHGTDKNFNKINMKKGTQQLFWFTSDKSSIEKGEVGANANGKVMELFAKITSPADWGRYDQLSLGEFKSRNLDGAILSKGDKEFDGFIFNQNQVKSATDNTGVFSTENPDIRYSISSEENQGDLFQREVGSWRKRINTVSDSVRSSMLHVFSAAGVYDIGGETMLPGGKEILTLVRKLSGRRDIMLNDYIHIRKDINEFTKKNHAKVGLIGDVANEATLLGASPAIAGNIDGLKAKLMATRPKGFEETIKRLNQLETNWKRLGEPAQKIYSKLAKYYADSHEAYIKAQKKAILDADLQPEEEARQLQILSDKFADTKLKGDYFPLMRFGKFGVAYTDGEVDTETGKEVKKFTKFDTSAEAKKFLENPKVNGDIIKDIDRGQQIIAGDNKTLTDLYKQLDKTFSGDPKEAQAEMKDFVFQMYLMGKPEQSMAKRFLHRKGTAGYSNDIFRGFDNYAMNMSRQLPRVELGREISNKLTAMEHSMPRGNIVASDYYSAFNREVKSAVHPKIVGPIANFATGAAFSYYLTSPASAALQLASVPIQGLPSIAKKHGYPLAQAALNAATNMYLKSGVSKSKGWWNIKRGAEAHRDIKSLVKGAAHADQFSPTKAYDDFLELGLITSGIHAQAFSGKDKPTNAHRDVMDKITNLMEKTSQPFAQMETASRQIVSMAHYIANMKSGMTHDEAVKKAVDAVYMDMGDFGSTGRADITKSDPARIIWQFQQYGAKMLYTMARSALKLTSKGERKEAITHLSGLMAMHWVFAGALGLPAAGMIGAASDMLRDLLDDDEWHNYKANLRSYLNSKDINKTLINVMLDGPLSELTGLKLSERLGAHDLLPIIHESQYNDSLNVSVKDRMIEMLGAAPALIINTGEGISAFVKGDYESAVEKLVPNAMIKNTLIAARLAREGKINKQGEQVVAKSEYTPYDIAAKAFGIDPYTPAQKEAAARMAKTNIEFINNKRTELLNEYKIENDSESGDIDKVIDKIDKFNEMYPWVAIENSNILSSVNTAIRNEALNIRGYNFKKMRDEAERLYPEMMAEDMIEEVDEIED